MKSTIRMVCLLVALAMLFTYPVFAQEPVAENISSQVVSTANKDTARNGESLLLNFYSEKEQVQKGEAVDFTAQVEESHRAYIEQILLIYRSKDTEECVEISLSKEDNGTYRGTWVPWDGLTAGLWQVKTVILCDAAGNQIYTIENAANETLAALTQEFKAAEVVLTDSSSVILTDRLVMDNRELRMSTGQASVLTAVFYPRNASNQALVWASDDESVAIVDEDGQVTAVSPGVATISAKTTDSSELLTTCTVTVDGANTGLRTFRSENGEMGIDVSFANSKVDWAKVKAQGITFAMIRIGFGDDPADMDSQFERNYSEAKKYGIKVGVYLYSYATSVEEAVREAQACLGWLNGRSLDFPVAFDIEDPNYHQNLSRDLCTRMATAFCDTIYQAGYMPMVYSYMYFFKDNLDYDRIKQYYLWLAQWGSQITYEHPVDMWQYTAFANIDGANNHEGFCDANYNYTDYIYVNSGNKKAISYLAHVADIGWMDWVSGGQIAGTTGESRQMEAFQITGISDFSPGSNVIYRANVADYGWMDWVSEGQTAGTTGESRQMEAIEIYLTGTLAVQNDIYYRVHVADLGWMGWAKNGESAGTSGTDKQIEAIQIVLIEKGKEAPGPTKDHYVGLTYLAHAAEYGWMNWVSSGQAAGTTAQSLRMEALQITTGPFFVNSGVMYRAHVADYGWMDWVSEGQTAGTTGESRRMEAIEIYLTGALAAQYDIYYRVHVADLGWLGWAKNGESAGTSGQSRQMEAIQIMLVKKGAAAPGITNIHFLNG